MAVWVARSACLFVELLPAVQRRCCSLGDMLAVKLAEDANLLLNVVNLIFCILEVDDLDGNCCSCWLVDAAVDLTASVWDMGELTCCEADRKGAHSPKASLSYALVSYVVILGVSTLRRWLSSIRVAVHGEWRLDCSLMAALEQGLAGCMLLRVS